MGPDRRVLIDSIVDRLTAMYARRHRAKEGRMARLGVSMTHFQALVQLADGPMTMSALARALDASLPSMSGIVDRIEARGLIERDRSSDDRRVVQVHLTQEGRDWLCEMEAMRRDKMERVLSHLDDDRLGRLSAALDDLLAAFSAAEAEAGADDAHETTENETAPGAAPMMQRGQVPA
jgi:DNA-binding MarR family transcriptional regulator